MNLDTSTVLVPEAVLPSQLCGGGGLAMQPEKRLMLAVLENAVWLVLHGGSARDGDTRRHAAEASRWLASEASQWPYAFVNVCQMLGLDPTWVRDGVHRQAAAQAGSEKRSRPQFAFRRTVGVRRRLARPRVRRRRAAHG